MSLSAGHKNKAEVASSTICCSIILTEAAWLSCVFVIKQKQALQTENVQSSDLLFTYIYVDIYLFAVAHVFFLKNIKLLKIEVLELFLEQWYCFPLCCKLCLTTILDNVFWRKKMVTFSFPGFIMLKLPANILK